MWPSCMAQCQRDFDNDLRSASVRSGFNLASSDTFVDAQKFQPRESEKYKEANNKKQPNKAHLSHHFWRSSEYFIYNQCKYLVLIRWSYRSPKLYGLSC